MRGKTLRVAVDDVAILTVVFMSHLHSANFNRKQLNNSIYINHAILVVITPGNEEKNEWDVIWLFCHFPPRILEPV